jgi:hypothetical protein
MQAHPNGEVLRRIALNPRRVLLLSTARKQGLFAERLRADGGEPWAAQTTRRTDTVVRRPVPQKWFGTVRDQEGAVGARGYGGRGSPPAGCLTCIALLISNTKLLGCLRSCPVTRFSYN